MREIKFRAWNKKKGIMNYDNEDGTEDYWDGMYASEIGMVNILLNMSDKDDHYSISSFRNKYEVMQYTGLKDKNGVEIYEGDILKGRAFQYQENIKGEVYYSKRGTWDCESFVLGGLNEDCEVIGNIYENPELMEVSK